MSLPIKLIKLKSGDNLVAKLDVKEDVEYATLVDPLLIHRWMSSDDGGGAYENATFAPWESFSKDDVFHISKNDILTLTNPREDVIIHYNRTIQKLKVTPHDRLDEDSTNELDEVMKLKKLGEIARDLNKKLGLDDNESLDEEIEDYYYNHQNTTKH